MRVYCVGPSEFTQERERDEMAVQLLRIPSLQAALEENGLEAEGSVAQQQRQLMEQIKRPMTRSDRLGLRVTELWVRYLSDKKSNETVEWDKLAWDEGEEFATVSVTCQKSSVQKFVSASSAVIVRLPHNSTIGEFREVFGADLPPTAKVLWQKPGRGLMTLQNNDLVPEEVTLTEFDSKGNYYMRMNDVQANKIFCMQRAFFQKPENQRKLDKLEKEAAGDHVKYGFAVAQLLMNEVYPAIAHRYGLREDIRGIRCIMNQLGFLSRVSVSWQNCGTRWRCSCAT